MNSTDPGARSIAGWIHLAPDETDKGPGRARQNTVGASWRSRPRRARWSECCAPISTRTCTTTSSAGRCRAMTLRRSEEERRSHHSAGHLWSRGVGVRRLQGQAWPRLAPSRSHAWPRGLRQSAASAAEVLEMSIRAYATGTLRTSPVLPLAQRPRTPQSRDPSRARVARRW